MGKGAAAAGMEGGLAPILCEPIRWKQRKQKSGECASSSVCGSESISVTEAPTGPRGIQGGALFFVFHRDGHDNGFQPLSPTTKSIKGIDAGLWT